MKKLLLGILLTSAISIAAQAGTEYTVTDHAADSMLEFASGNFGIARYNSRIAMSSTYDIGILYQHRTTAQSFRALLTANLGGNFTTFVTAGLFTQAASSYYGAAMYGFGDSLYALSCANGTTIPFRIRQIVSSDTLRMDTVSTSSASAGDRPGMTFIGNTAFVVHVTEDGTTDSIRGYQGNKGIDSNTVWTQRWVAASVGNGQRVPFTWSGGTKGGIMLVDITNEDALWGDTTGLYTASTALVPDNLPALGAAAGGGGENMLWVVPVKDSFFVVYWQSSVTAANCSTLYRPGHITGTGTGSVSITWDAAAGVLISVGKIPGGYVSMPTGATLWGTDTTIAYSAYWPDTTRKQSIQIVRWLSTDKGATWGAMAVDRDSTGHIRTMAALQAPYRVYRNGNDIEQALMYCDSSTVVHGDSLRLWLSTITTAVTINTLATFLLDSLHNDYSGDADSLQFRTVTGAQTGDDSVIITWSTSAYPDSGANGGNRYAFAYTENHTDTTKKTVTLTETGTVYASAWVRDGANWSLRKTISRAYAAANLQPYTLLKKKKG